MTLPINAAIRAHADGYDMAKPALMGRQAAGNGFLRAAVKARGQEKVLGFAPNAATAAGFEAIVRLIDPAAPFEWVSTAQPEKLAKAGVLYLADITLAAHARARLRSGVAAYSLCGVTHTTASQGSMAEIAALLQQPAMPWDALVCTSSAVVETVRKVHEAEADYLRWRLGADIRFDGPQLPVIPLGVHCDDFVFSDTQRQNARQALQLDPDEVAGLFVGRLVFHAKAHPFAMYRGLQMAAERTGKKVALILCGWSPSEGVAEAFRSGAAQFAPDVRLIFVEGRDPSQRDIAWSASDIFLSLADNIQETFGLTPIEGMAAGLPVVVTDWDGYKDTVRDGIDGFRISTLAPMPGMGQPIASGYEAGSLGYDRYCWSVAATTAIDLGQLTDALALLIADPAVRRRMGEAGRKRAREIYDWSGVYGQYQALWAELNARRTAATTDATWAARLASAPQALSTNLDPYDAFAHYPTHQIGGLATVVRADGADDNGLAECLAHPLFGGLPTPVGDLAQIFGMINTAPQATAGLARASNRPLAVVVRAVGQLAKMGLVVIRPGSEV